MRFGMNPALSRILPLALLVGGYSALVYLFDRSTPGFSLPWSGVVEGAFIFALGMIMAVRVNRAYERWWEARMLWGSLVNVSRNLAVKVHTMVRPDEQERNRFRQALVGFAYALRDHLRGEAALARVKGFEQSTDNPGHVPSYLTEQVYLQLSRWRAQARIDSEQLRILDQESRMLLEVCGACERINNTPLPRAFRQMVKQVLVLFMLAFPWLLIDEFGALTIPVVTLATYVLLAGESIADAIEHPFDARVGGLELTPLCRTIDVTVTEILAREPALVADRA